MSYRITVDRVNNGWVLTCDGTILVVQDDGKKKIDDILSALEDMLTGLETTSIYIDAHGVGEMKGTQ